jgi:hypothetical protein
MMENMPDDDSPESKEEETVRRDACAIGFIGKASSYNPVWLMLTTIYSWLRYCKTNNVVLLNSFLRTLPDGFYSYIILHGYGTLSGRSKESTG